MAEPFLSEIRMMSFNFPPKGWALANGQLLPINQNQALFSLLGTMYGGDGRVNFALPNLRGRVAIHFGDGFTLGEAAGQSAHTLTISEMPAHNHFCMASTTTADQAAPGGNFLGAPDTSVTGTVYAPPSALTALEPGTVGNTGGSQAHTNQMPSLVISFCIALQGIFPSQN
jgi:microcystin-dependent protein